MPTITHTKDGDPAIIIRHFVLALRLGKPNSSNQLAVMQAYPARDPAELSRKDFYITSTFVADEAAFIAHAQELIDHYDQVSSLQRMPVPNSRSTPWGGSQDRLRYEDGVESVSCAGHGGFLLSPEKNDLIDAEWRSSAGAYEEDEEWAIVAFTFPHLFTQYEMKFAHRTLKNHRPDTYERLTGTTIPDEECETRRRAAFYKEHANDLIVVSAISLKNDPSMVVCQAGRGGRGVEGRHLPPTNTYLVPSDEYSSNRRPYGFIIDENRHEQIEDNDHRLSA